VGPRAFRDASGKSRPTGIRSPDRPVRSESLYQLSYPGPCRCRWEDNIEMDHQEVTRVGMFWIDVAQDGDGWRAFVNMVINLESHKMLGIS